jgi:hypothetical protein
MRYALCLAALVVFVVAGCGGNSDTAAPVAAKYGLHLVGAPDAYTQTLPSNLTYAHWDRIQRACLDAGFDLRPFLGERVTYVTYALKERMRGGRMSLTVYGHGEDIVAAYVTVEGKARGTYGLRHVEGQL